MFLILIFLAVLVVHFCCVNSLVYTLEEKIESCNNGSKHFMDIDAMNFTMITDTETVANGKVKALTTIDKVWRVGFFGERYDRGQWNLMMQRKMDDFCNHILNPTEL